MSPTFGVIPHRLIPGVSVSCCADPIGLTWSVADAYGFAAASWDQLDPPAGVGTILTIGSEGATVFEGKIKSTSDPAMVGERLLYHVECVGSAEDLKADETVEGVFVDRDVSQWQAASSGWADAPDFEIGVEVSDSIMFRWPEVVNDHTDALSGGVQVWKSGPRVDYQHVGNQPPAGWHRTDFFAPPKLWSASFYDIGGGATAKRVTHIAFTAYWNLLHPAIDAMRTPDYDHPVGEPDPKYGNRHNGYPLINLWSGLLGIDPPDNAFAGVYVCDDPLDLPTDDPEAMAHDPHLIMRFEGQMLFADDRAKFKFDTDGRFVCFYAAYLPVRYPMYELTRYDEDEDHLVCRGWWARTRLLACSGQFLWVKNVEVCAQGYKPKDDGSDDLRDVLAILYPNVSAPAMKLPPSPTGSPRTIAFRSATTMLAAIVELLGMHPDQFSWGIWEGKQLLIEHPESAAGYSFSDEAGVDATGCGVSNEGAVDLVQVAYSLPTHSYTDGKLRVNRTQLLVVDRFGSYEIVGPEWEPAEGMRCAYENAVDRASSPKAAAAIGQGIAVERRPDQACGGFALYAITGASRVRTGGIASGPGVPADARITGVAVSVDADTVSVTLGPSGYVGRFPQLVPGKPLSASPSASANGSSSRGASTRTGTIRN